MKTFTINGKSYKAKELDFNGMCELEDFGVSMTDVSGKNLSLVRAYFAFCSGKSAENAGKEIQAHMLGGGKLDELAEIMKDAIDNSDFFRALAENAEKEAAEIKTA